VGIVWRDCDIFGVHNMWGLCGTFVTYLEFIICGKCVERM
jgi:hypothetical protein